MCMNAPHVCVCMCLFTCESGTYIPHPSCRLCLPSQSFPLIPCSKISACLVLRLNELLSTPSHLVLFGQVNIFLFCMQTVLLLFSCWLWAFASVLFLTLLLRENKAEFSLENRMIIILIFDKWLALST